ncbi:OST-HTH/LOTUS domain-containing protein [Nonomuraea sp. NPDC001699]
MLVNLLRNALQAYSDDDRWAGVANVGHFITKQRPDFDARTYGYAKLSDLIAATTLFELDRRTPSDGKPAIVYVRDKRHQSKSPLVTPPTNQQGSTIPASEPGQNATRLTESSGYPGATQ